MRSEIDQRAGRRWAAALTATLVLGARGGEAGWQRSASHDRVGALSGRPATARRYRHVGGAHGGWPQPRHLRWR